MMKLLQFAIALMVFFLIGMNIQANKQPIDTPAPAFSISDAEGTEHKFPGNHEGVEIYLFWATWCPYCKALMPHLQSIQIEYGDAVRIYALHIRDDEDPGAFLDKQGYDFILLPSADPVMKPYGVVASPALFLVDRKGNIRLNLYELIFDQPEISELPVYHRNHLAMQQDHRYLELSRQATLHQKTEE